MTNKWDEHIELRSDEVNEIIGKTPGWLVRWGTFSFAMVLLILLLGSFWFKYPDRIISQITLSSVQPPIELVARTDGKIDHWLANDKQFVEAGQILAVIESAADYRAVMKLREQLDEVHTWIGNRDSSLIRSFVENDYQGIGSLKNNMASLLTHLSAYLDHLEFKKYQVRIQAINNEIFDANLHYQRLFNQKSIKQDELDLAEKSFGRQSKLYESGSISAVQYEAEKQKLTAARYEFGETRTALSAQQAQITKLKNQLKNEEVLEMEEFGKLVAAVDEQLTILHGAIREWSLAY